MVLPQPDRVLAVVLPIALSACVNGPQEAAPVPVVQTVSTAGPRAVAVANIPVDDPKTKSVSAALFEPQGAGPFPAVVILSGCGGVGPDAGIAKRVSSEYPANGIATLVVDSFTPRGIYEVCSVTSFLIDSLSFRVKDAYAAMTWLGNRPEIDATHIFLQGYSHGAMTAIAAIDARSPRIHAQKAAGVIAFYPYCYSGSRFSVPTIILIGGADDWTPAKLCEDIVDKTNVEITVYPDALHQFAAPGLDIVYLGHHLLYDEAAADDGQRRALAFVRSLSK